MTTDHPIVVPYFDARREIRDGDLLLFRSRNWYTRLISAGGRSAYVHAAMAGWWKDRLMCVEMTSGGGRAQLLSNIVQEWPGVCDVYESNPGGLLGPFDREKALTAMIGITGRRYGWVNLFHAALLHMIGIRLVVTPETDDTADNQLPPFCSDALSMAYRTAGGVDPVPNLADRLTEPGDLARSPFFAYRFTLVI